MGRGVWENEREVWHRMEDRWNMEREKLIKMTELYKMDLEKQSVG